MIRGDILYKRRDKLNKHNKRIIIVTVVLIVFSVFTLLGSRSSSPIESIFKDTVANIEYYLIKAPIQYVGNLFSEYNELKDVYEENKQLKKQLDKYAREAALNEVLASELEQLKEMTNIDILPTDYKIMQTTVIARDAGSWNNQVIINLGKSSGIKEGMAVITSKGMVGTVTEVGELSSTVSLLTSEKSNDQLPVMIISGGKEYYGLLNKYDIDSQSYRITLLSDVEKIDKDARVVTSGLGGEGKSPKGILVGTVEKFTASSDTTESVCMVKPSVDFSSLNYVAVVQRVNAK